jgi:hypothetical protein
MKLNVETSSSAKRRKWKLTLVGKDVRRQGPWD